MSLTLARVTALLRDAGLLREVVDAHDAATFTGVTQDSRSVRLGDLFLAWKGTDHDAHDYLGEVAAAGARGAVVERAVGQVDLPQIVVNDGRLAGALVADLAHGSPWKHLFIAAVTGTNGKTTTSLILQHLLLAKGPTASVGTLGLVQADGSVRPGTEELTTPGPVRLSAWLRMLVEEGFQNVTLEASSHALAQRRLDAFRVDVAVFTNLSRDHLDYHGGFNEYLAAKSHLAELVKENGALVVNADEAVWRHLPSGPRQLSFGLHDAADVSARRLGVHRRGSRFHLAFEDGEWPVELPLPGRFNVSNALAASAAALAAGLPVEDVVARLRTAPQIPGRMEVVHSDRFTVLIDFAHTPDALGRVLEALAAEPSGRLIVLFGAGGDRDPSKRAPMAKAVAARADLVVLTSDNPRTEDPEEILNDLEQGIAGVEYLRITDRKKAISSALGLAHAGDVVLLAGKGHETYQVVGTEKRPFDERSVVHEYFERGAA